MTARTPTLLIVALALLMSGCATFQDTVRTALGIGTREMREARRLAREERAAQITDEQIEHRLAFLTQRLDERRLHAAAWKYGWLVVNAGGGIAAATRAGLENDETHRINNISLAGKAAIGVAYLLLNPMPGTSGADPVRDMPAFTREERLARLEVAEELLAREAERAHDRTSWLLHFGNVFLNAAASAPALAYGDAGLAAQGFGIGTAVGEVQIWTQPWKGPADWKEYLQFVTTDGTVPPEPEAEWQIIPNGVGIGVAARF